MPYGSFRFEGRGLSYWWLAIWTTVLTVVTFGIYWPWAYSAKQRWIAKNTYVDGKQLVFMGTGAGFFVTWLLIIILSIVTFGLYAPWAACRIKRWQINNLYYADAGDNEQF
ncbi:DUF898 family protein [Desulfobaculum bizertense]|uniref:DUF898 domain-containing protein n=1 Tax=Desulfobaculum bizertense DSM 18034 TaxID=1121442 RepID=A0A1T4VZK2_9BACT|nr:DUF898 family protein [Desulfobaculum bizertense]SKA70238.1 protein of unknown function [Desulfobaculum bizertense DSM 18034]